jgi:hypothetical protein
MHIAQQPNLPQQEDDEICDELMKLQFKLKEQVCTNIEQITCLERAVQTVKGSEERAREYLAMNKLVERAYTRRMVMLPCLWSNPEVWVVLVFCRLFCHAIHDIWS